MREYHEEYEFELTEHMFTSALNRVKKKNPTKYPFILKAGSSLRNAIFSLCKSVWKKEILPEAWKKTDIVQLYKGKGKETDLNNYRNIHTKKKERKIFGEIVTHELKSYVVSNISKFQIGAIPGHRVQEHIFSIKSVIGFFNSMGKGLILTLYNVSKFFDRENLRDALNEMYKLSIKGKVYRLLYQLNKDTHIRVKTAVGFSDFANVGEGLGQGTNESAVVSSASLSGGVSEAFANSTTEVRYASLPMAPCLFVDDIARLSENLEAVQDGNKGLKK